MQCRKIYKLSVVVVDLIMPSPQLLSSRSLVFFFTLQLPFTILLSFPRIVLFNVSVCLLFRMDQASRESFPLGNFPPND